MLGDCITIPKCSAQESAVRIQALEEAVDLRCLEVSGGAQEDSPVTVGDHPERERAHAELGCERGVRVHEDRERELVVLEVGIERIAPRRVDRGGDRGDRDVRVFLEILVVRCS
ncbi:MAG: hypothetical protein JRE18_11095, partial [Deltaproteobacteria bacterium]|nr:hypothetical protein [Deltaproteobacteria bacterium]